MSTEGRIDKRTAKFIARIAENLPDMDGDQMQEWIENPVDLQDFLSGLGTPHDTLIRIDRSVRPNSIYENDGKEIMLLHPELEGMGPSEYDLAKIRCYTHPVQKHKSGISGEGLYWHLRDTDSLKHCLGIQDAIEIKRKGLRVFRKLFGKKIMICWKSIGRDSEGTLRAPYICEVSMGRSGRNILSMGWGIVTNPTNEIHFAAQFPEN